MRLNPGGAANARPRFVARARDVEIKNDRRSCFPRGFLMLLLNASSFNCSTFPNNGETFLSTRGIFRGNEYACVYLVKNSTCRDTSCRNPFMFYLDWKIGLGSTVAALMGLALR